MTRFVVARSTDPGATSLTRPIGSLLPDPFFDNYQEQVLTARDILNAVADNRAPHITITIDRMFLREIVRSHIHEICRLTKEPSAYRD